MHMYSPIDTVRAGRDGATDPPPARRRTAAASNLTELHGELCAYVRLARYVGV
mgnify:CR=1